MFSKKAVVSHEVPLPHNRLTHFLHTLQVTTPQKMKQIRKKKPAGNEIELKIEIKMK